MNPFEIRAADYVKNDSSFLRLVAPEPLHALFGPKAGNGTLFHRLIRVFGTPGSGKTTLAHLVSFRRMMLVIHQYQHVSAFQPLMRALTACGFVVEDTPAVIGTVSPSRPLTGISMSFPTTTI